MFGGWSYSGCSSKLQIIIKLQAVIMFGKSRSLAHYI